MENRRRGFALVILIATCMLLAACGGEDCVINNTVMVTMNFYASDGSPVMLNDELTVAVVRPGNDSIVLNRRVPPLGFPSLGYTDESDTFVFRFGLTNIVDSVFIHHTNQPYFISSTVAQPCSIP